MRKWVFGTILVIVAIGLGLVAAWGTSVVFHKRTTRIFKAPSLDSQSFPESGFSNDKDAWGGAGNMMGGHQGKSGDKNFPGGMMSEFTPNIRNRGCSPWNRNSGSLNPGARISLDQAVTSVEAYLKNYVGDSSGLEIKEVMEFENNFYTLVVEKNDGKGAFELLVDPFSGAVLPEPGPNMMWNLKYGHMRWGGSTGSSENKIGLEEAKTLAQKAVSNDNSKAEIEGAGTEFYGYYTFDYAVDGQIVGMLSINGNNGQAWFHNWHGKFISEKEIGK